MFKSSLLIVTMFCLLAQAGCASYFKRGDCERTNWFEHGRKVAMSGKRLDADSFIKECQEVEAKFSFSQADLGFKAGMADYCKDANILEVGKAGKPFSFEMCDGRPLQKMQGQYAKGLEIFCSPANGYRFGAEGGIYAKNCPSQMEEAWLVEYRKGRKVHLLTVAEAKEREIRLLQQEIDSLQSDVIRYTQDMNHALLMAQLRRETDRARGDNQLEEATIIQPTSEATHLKDKIRNAESDIQRKREQIRDISDEVSRIRMEAATL